MVAVRSNKEMVKNSSLDTNRPIQVTDWAIENVVSSLHCMNDPQAEGRMASHIGRRKFLATLGGAAASWPLAARAQQRERIRRIGLLMNLAADDPEAPARIAAFAQGLADLGWSIGRNLRIDYRWGAGDAERIGREAAELLAAAPDVVLASGNPSAAALQQATRSVPIVFAGVNDPVSSGFVESLAQPGGNITGFSLFEYSFSEIGRAHV